MREKRSCARVKWACFTAWRGACAERSSAAKTPSRATEMWVSSVENFGRWFHRAAGWGGAPHAGRPGRRQALVPGPRPQPRRLRLAVRSFGSSPRFIPTLPLWQPCHGRPLRAGGQFPGFSPLLRPLPGAGLACAIAAPEPQRWWSILSCRVSSRRIVWVSEISPDATYGL